MNTDHITGFACGLLVVGIILALINLAVAWYLDALMQEVYEFEAENLFDSTWAISESHRNEVR